MAGVLLGTGRCCVLWLLPTPLSDWEKIQIPEELSRVAFESVRELHFCSTYVCLEWRLRAGAENLPFSGIFPSIALHLPVNQTFLQPCRERSSNPLSLLHEKSSCLESTVSRNLTVSTVSAKALGILPEKNESKE